MHINIAIADQQHQNNLQNYHLVKNMNSTLKKIIIAAINDQLIKEAKYMVTGYANKYFIDFMV